MDTVVELNGKKLIPRELTVREVETVLESLMGEETHLLETIVPEEPVPAKAVGISVGVDLDALLDLPPSQITTLFQQVRERNPYLARRIEAIAAIAGQVLDAARQEEMEKTQEVEASAKALPISGEQSAG